MPGRSTSPPVGRRRPASSRVSVDLPEPFAPTIASSSSARTSRVTPASASVSAFGYRKRTSRSTTGSGSGATDGSSVVVTPGSSTTAAPNAPRTRRSAGVDRPSASQIANHNNTKNVSGTLIHQSRTTHVDETVARCGEARESEIAQQMEQAVPAVANLVERQPAEVREHEQRHVGDHGRGRTQRREPDQHGAAAAPAPAVARADERADRRAHAHRREGRTPDDEEPDRGRRDRAGDDRAQAVPRGNDRQRNDGRREQRRAEGHDLTDDREREGDVGQHDRFCELTRPERTVPDPPIQPSHPDRIAYSERSSTFAVPRVSPDALSTRR